MADGVARALRDGSGTEALVAVVQSASHFGGRSAVCGGWWVVCRLCVRASVCGINL